MKLYILKKELIKNFSYDYSFVLFYQMLSKVTSFSTYQKL